jgi:hypothetical protein
LALGVAALLAGIVDLAVTGAWSGVVLVVGGILIVLRVTRARRSS